MKGTERYIDEHFNKTSLTYNFGNGSYIEFFSADSPDKLKGARRDILYINECNNVTFDAYIQLSVRTRGDIYLDYNPDRMFWAMTEVESEPDAEKIILNYLDNEALDESVIKQFQINREKAEVSEYWKNWCRVYIDGEVGSLEGVIFNNWRAVDIVPNTAEIIGIGMDFGFTNDPTAAVAVYKGDDKIYIDELFYETGLKNSDIDRLLAQNLPHKNIEIFADSSDPKTIAEIKSRGWRISGVNKVKGGISWGIGLMQEKELLVTRRSLNVIDEFRNYQWKKDSTGMKTNIPIDAYNHACDAIRYLFMSKLGGKNPGVRKPFFIG